MSDVLQFIELKSGYRHNGPAWIAWTTRSRSGKTVYFDGKALKRCRPTPDGGNHIDVRSGDHYWVSGPKKNGEDRHRTGAGKVIVEADVVDHYLAFIGRAELDRSRYDVSDSIQWTFPSTFHAFENEPEDEGGEELRRSHRSGQVQQKRGFVRFVVAEVDDTSERRLGVLQAIYDARRNSILRDDELQVAEEQLEWFGEELERPTRFSRSRGKQFPTAGRGLSWFKDTAREHVARLRTLCAILEQHEICTFLVWTDRPGYLVYEDDFQIVAEPFQDTRT